MAFDCTSPAETEVALRRQIAELAALDPGILEPLHLLVHAVLEAARTRVEAEARRTLSPTVRITTIGHIGTVLVQNGRR